MCFGILPFLVFRFSEHCGVQFPLAVTQLGVQCFTRTLNLGGATVVSWARYDKVTRCFTLGLASHCNLSSDGSTVTLLSLGIVPRRLTGRHEI